MRPETSGTGGIGFRGGEPTPQWVLLRPTQRTGWYHCIRRGQACEGGNRPCSPAGEAGPLSHATTTLFLVRDFFASARGTPRNNFNHAQIGPGHLHRQR